MGTARLYYTDSYLKEFDAQVIGTEEGGTLVQLDRTAFYPTSGGQPSDKGWCNGIEVIEAFDEEDTIVHRLAAPLAMGPVRCKLDWRRRYDHMQQHTGQHLLSAVFTELFGFETLSFHMGPEISTIELSTDELTAGQRQQAEERAAQLVRMALPVNIGFAESQNVGGLRKASARSGELRLIEIEGVDRSACGGTHVGSTAELGLITLRNQDRVRSRVRVEFICGDRCLVRARNDFLLLSQMARSGGVPVENLPAHFQKIRERLARSESENFRLRTENARREGYSLWSSVGPNRDGIRKCVHEVLALDETTRALAQGFVGNGQAALLLICRNPPSLLLAVSKDSGTNAGAAIKSAFAKFNGRGGGSPTLAQGTVPREPELLAVAQELGFAISPIG
jgi:alanyl-tRNA synthetase